MCDSSILQICSMVADLNHGKDLNGRKYSFSSMNNQKPCSEIFVTSRLEVFFPCFDNFIFMFLNQFLQVVQLTFCKSGVCRQCDNRLDPEFRFPFRRDDMNMNSRLLSGEEIKPVTPNSYNCRTHTIYYMVNHKGCQYL